MSKCVGGYEEMEKGDMAQSAISQVKHTADSSKNPGKPISICCNFPYSLS